MCSDEGTLDVFGADGAIDAFSIVGFVGNANQGDSATMGLVDSKGLVGHASARRGLRKHGMPNTMCWSVDISHVQTSWEVGKCCKDSVLLRVSQR